MIRLVVCNLVERKTRSAITVLGVVVGVVLVLLTGGLARGQLVDRARREAGSGADIFVRPSGAAASPVSTMLTIDVAVGRELESLPGIRSIVPIAQHIERNEASAFGFRSFDGVDVDRYAAMSGLRIVTGRAPERTDEAIVSEYFARTGQGAVGDTLSFAGAPIRIVGVYGPESMSRIKVPIATVQERFDARGLASMLMIEVDEGADVEAVARAVAARLPDDQIVLVRDLPATAAAGVPALRVFLAVVTGLALVVSTIVIMLTMYSTVMERTRQIGILRSLGASRGLVLVAIEGEAILIGAAGVVVGAVVSGMAAAALEHTTTLRVELDAWGLVTTAIVGVLAGALGALYPALRAASLDPVTALAHE